MVLGRRTKHHPGGTTVTTTTTTTHHPPDELNASGARAVRTKPTLKQRLLGGRRTRATAATPTRRRRVGVRRRTPATTTATPRRKASVGDKISGAMLKLKGTLTRRPGQKAAGARRMHGTDGRGTRRYY
ncbi:uncharacterized protein A1O5_05453 [Cladophialophora psammophila CBS 110553]|uniref:Uncharacterized protein n=1 Tax=Cladophialophora psammophila CBS 110553 TaxID=1182543 RepID=W9X2V6_9EURO|nr:uncharacterized protein A1O5_05453 [Cladophialophora psammophila CBS 110553]EXJ71645.1 hypothetical protein A1O5_05453 [Cladophialophora psammophila CBS 110553]